MKIFSLIMLIILVGTGFCFVQKGQVYEDTEEVDCFRIHIVANSNTTADQEIKFVIKNAIVDYLTPIVADCSNKEECINAVKLKLDVLTCVVDTELKNAGFDYHAKLDVTKKDFPTRYYENIILKQGEYDCICVELGEAKGDNWWCVVYPPLCFVNKNKCEEQDIVYQSKILEIVKKYF